MEEISLNPYKLLLSCLDTDDIIASEKYLKLHTKIIKIMIWRGCPEVDAENLADVTLDRTAKKLSEIENELKKGIKTEKDEEIKKIENINAYASEVARFVWLEYYKKHLKNRVKDENAVESLIQPATDPPIEPDLRLRCLRKCIAEKIPDERDKQLVIGYYSNETEEKNKVVREILREKHGLSKANFKTKVCRLRDRLEKCINECVSRLSRT